MTSLTLEQAWAAFHYCPDTGNFYHKRRTCRKEVGAIAQFHRGNGYYRLRVGGAQHYAHRVAWFMTFGTWPLVIDHINGNPSDNRIANLRECSVRENCLNKRARKDSASGIKGVYLCPHGKWKAVITVDKNSRYLGYFDTAEEARRAYDEAAVELHGEFARAA